MLNMHDGILAVGGRLTEEALTSLTISESNGAIRLSIIEPYAEVAHRRHIEPTRHGREGQQQNDEPVPIP